MSKVTCKFLEIFDDSDDYMITRFSKQVLHPSDSCLFYNKKGSSQERKDYLFAKI